MNKKGQGVGMFIGLAIGVIVCLILFQAVAGNVEQGTQQVTGASVARNTTIAAGPLNAITEVTGQELVGALTITRVDGTVIPAANYTLAECVRTSDNLKGICYKNVLAASNNTAVNVSYSYYPSGYIDDAGGRSIAGIIILLAAIGIAVVVISGSRFDY
jgi:hypothetical protein